MGIMSEYDLVLSEVREVMQHDQPIDVVGRTVRDAFAALDDLVILANKPESRDQVRGERVMIGQLLTRCQLLASFVRPAN